MADVLQDYRKVWDRKPVLRLVYNDFFERIAAACACGMTIEIGGGNRGSIALQMPSICHSRPV